MGSFNHVTNLLESNGFIAMVVFIDKLTKRVYFIGCKKEVRAMEYAQIVIDNIFQLHGLPEVIISNQDPYFISNFWRALFDLFGTDLQFSIAFHLQTDGQSEQMMHMLENFLRSYVEIPPDLESVLGVSRICSTQC